MRRNQFAHEQPVKINIFYNKDETELPPVIQPTLEYKGNKNKLRTNHGRGPIPTEKATTYTSKLANGNIPKPGGGFPPLASLR